MKIALIQFSPTREGNSDFLLNEIKKAFLNTAETIDYYFYYDEPGDLSCYDRIIIVAPVYFKGVPSKGLDFLRKAEKNNKHSGKPLVFFLSNCGFPDAGNNLIPFEIVKNWCEQCGFEYAYSVGLSYTMRLSPYPIEPKPKEKKSILNSIISSCRKCFAYDMMLFGKNLSKHGYKTTIDTFISDIESGRRRENVLIQPFLSKSILISNMIIDTFVFIKKNIMKD